MQSYKYLCIDDQGIRRRGSIRAVDQRAAQQELLGRGWTLVNLGEQRFLFAPPQSEDRIYRLTEQERNRFLLKLSILLRAGIPLVTALISTAQGESEKQAHWTDKVVQHVEGGNPLSQALQLHDVGFAAAAIALVRLGEQTGGLLRVLQRLAEQGRRGMEKKAELKAKLTYPFVQLVIMGILCLLLGAYFGPHLNSMVESLGGSQPALTRWVTKLMSPTVLGTVAGLGCLVSILAALTWSTPAGQQFRGQVIESIPVLRELRWEILTVDFCDNLAHLLSCGFDWQRALELCHTGSQEFDAQTEQFRRDIMDGDFEGAVESSAHFTPLLKSLMLVGYQSQRIPELLQLYSRMLEQSVERRLEMVLKLLEPALLMFLGVGVGVVVIASFLPVMSLVKQL
jgi:type II secretory pathway component PulF